MKFLSFVIALTCWFVLLSPAGALKPPTRLTGRTFPHRTNTLPIHGSVQNSFMRELGISQPAAMAAATPAAVPAILLRPNLPREVTQFLYKSPLATSILAMTPSVVKSFISSIYPGELLLLLLFRTFYSRLLKFAHRVQIVLWKSANLGTPNEWKSSILGFMHERGKLLSKLITFNYLAKLACGVLGRVGFNIRSDLPDLLSRISYALFLAQFADLFKTQFLRTFFPKVGESKRQSYIINKSASVTIWTIGGLVACEMLSTYLKVPLSSTLAFGGVGGLAVGLSLRDIAANFMGGMMLLFNEPFTPGDMVTFKSGKTEIVGRVERVGWGQTRIRGRDTRPTYVPNSHFAQAAVTNMERITHRKYEAVVPIRFEDYGVMVAVIERVRERLRGIPKLDVLSMPFRVSFTRVGAYSLEVEIVCYFATKSIDEFLSLQQMANIEVIGAIHDCGASLALPTSQMQVHSVSSASSIFAPDAAYSAGPGANPYAPAAGRVIDGRGVGGYYDITRRDAGYVDVDVSAAPEEDVAEEAPASADAIEAEVREALRDTPLPSQEDSIPLGTSAEAEGKGFTMPLPEDNTAKVSVYATTQTANSSVGRNVTAAAKPLPRRPASVPIPVATDRYSPARESYFDGINRSASGVTTAVDAGAVPPNAATSARARSQSADRSIAVSATAAAASTSTNPATGGAVEDGVTVTVPALWQDFLRSAGIVPDGRKYFSDERVTEFGDNSFGEQR